MTVIRDGDSFKIDIVGAETRGGTTEAAISGSAPSTGGPYGQQNGGWVKVVEEAAENGLLYGRKDAGWTEVVIPDPQVEPYALVVETEADLIAALGPAVGGFYTLPSGTTFVKGVVTGAPGQPPVFQLSPGTTIKIPRGAGLATGLRRGVIIIAASPNGAIQMAGGSLSNPLVSNFGGPDVVVAEDSQGAGGSTLIENVSGVGSTGAFSFPSATVDHIVEMINCAHVSVGGGKYGLHVDSAFAALSLVSCSFVNSGNEAAWTAIDIDSGCALSTGLSLTGCRLVDNRAPPQAGNTGLLVDGSATITTETITNCTWDGFDGAGSAALSGASADDTDSVWSGCLGVENSNPNGELGLNNIVTPPTTSIPASPTWAPLVVTGAVLEAGESLFITPSIGELQATWSQPTRAKLKGILALVKSGGGAEVTIQMRFAISTAAVPAWTGVGTPMPFGVKSTISQGTAETIIDMEAGDKVRVEVSATVGVDVDTAGYTFSAGV